MACPFFYPIAKREDRTFVIPPRLPLGDPYEGECRAQSISFVPDEKRLSGYCSNGYGRASCERFPTDAATDAVRFHVTECVGRTIRIQYVFEKDCWPAGHGLLEYSEQDSRFEQAHENDIVQRQAEAFLESYLRRRS